MDIVKLDSRTMDALATLQAEMSDFSITLLETRTYIRNMHHGLELRCAGRHTLEDHKSFHQATSTAQFLNPRGKRCSMQPAPIHVSRDRADLQGRAAIPVRGREIGTPGLQLELRVLARSKSSRTLDLGEHQPSKVTVVVASFWCLHWPRSKADRTASRH